MRRLLKIKFKVKAEKSIILNKNKYILAESFLSNFLFKSKINFLNI